MTGAHEATKTVFLFYRKFAERRMQLQTGLGPKAGTTATAAAAGKPVAAVPMVTDTA